MRIFSLLFREKFNRLIKSYRKMKLVLRPNFLKSHFFFVLSSSVSGLPKFIFYYCESLFRALLSDTIIELRISFKHQFS